MPTLLDRLSLYRVVFVTLVFGSSAMITAAASSWRLTLPVIGLLIPVGVTMLLAFVYLALIYQVPELRLNKAFLAIQHVVDSVVLAVPIVLGDGTASPFTALYVILILVAALTHSFRFALTMSLLCCCIVAAIGYLEANAMLPGIRAPGKVEVIREILLRDFVYFGMFFVLGLLPAKVMERARATDERLIDLHRDYLLAQELNRLVVDQVSSGIGLLDQVGRLILLNQSGQKLLAKVGIENRQNWLREICNNPNGFSDELKFETENGIATIAFTLTHIESGGLEGGKLLIFQDISQRKAIEEKLEQERRLSAIGQLSANLAHEIRNPLAAISNSFQLLDKQLTPNDRARQLLTIQEREIRRMDRLVSDFLSFARPRQPVVERVSIESSVTIVAERIRLDPACEGVEIKLEGVSDVADIIVDAELFQQAFGNLLLNAAQWSSSGSTVYIRASQESRFVRLEVENHGPPIPPEIRSRLYEPFTSGRPDGTGLGLSIAWSAVQTMQGLLTLVKSDKLSTVFALLLPMSMTESTRKKNDTAD